MSLDALSTLETMYQMLRDAKDTKSSICVCYIDLANAYGSVKRSLFHFLLEWYHVPDHFRAILYAFYEGLMAAITKPAVEKKIIQRVVLKARCARSLPSF